ncbi:MAG TPA: FAD-binding oxidoreductase, partial [Thiolinea sp.]|nr:FAD-binding oxidoreductase [Thiolinea sp.]
HPYTIASAWNPTDKHIKFVIKELGDHTKTLNANLKVGQNITIEGPYGRFDFIDKKPRQIWIGGGIGITPFIAQMNQLALQPDGKQIDFFHTTKEVSETALAKLSDDVKDANINLHLLIDNRDGYLSVEKIQAAVPDWKNASIWFCGPSAFGEKLKAELTKAGLKTDDFHQEVFALR